MDLKPLIYKVQRFAVKNAPTILTVSGLGLCVGATVVTAKNAPKAQAAIQEFKAAKIVLDEAAEAGITTAGEEYTATDYENDKKIITSKVVKDVVKAYAVPALLEIAGGACVLYGNHLSNKRLDRMTGLAAAFATSYGNYRRLVQAELGAEKEQQIYNKTTAPEKTTPVPTRKKEKTTDLASLTLQRDAGGYSPFSFTFEKGIAGWTNSPSMNRSILEQKQETANALKTCYRLVTVNDVLYTCFGVQKAQLPIEGYIFGWDKNDPECPDIRFGFDNLNQESSCAFIAGKTPNVIIDFNCKNIYAAMDKVMLKEETT